MAEWGRGTENKASGEGSSGENDEIESPVGGSRAARHRFTGSIGWVESSRCPLISSPTLLYP